MPTTLRLTPPHRLSDQKPPIGAIKREALQPPAATLPVFRDDEDIARRLSRYSRPAPRAFFPRRLSGASPMRRSHSRLPCLSLIHI